MYVFASFVAAFFIGHMAQKGDQDTAIFVSAELASDAQTSFVDPASIQLASADSTSGIDLPRAPVAALSSGFGQLAYPAERTHETLIGNPLKNTPRFNAYGVACDSSLLATSLPAAMVSLDISTSCHLNQTFVIQQGALRISGVTSAVGFASLGVPALSALPEFSVTFEDGLTLKTAALVDDFKSFERAAVQWQGNSGLQLHALEFGSDYGQAGHVWRDAPRSEDYALGALGGFLTRVGSGTDSQTWHAEIYSFPSDTFQNQGVVRLSVEAEITAQNCEKEVMAQVLQPKSPTGIEVVDLSLAMPDCGAIGDFLLLNNLLRDLKIAQN
jgi:hypothetical protein